MNGFIIFYLVGYAVASAWTFAKMWRKDFCKEPRWVRLLFSLILGLSSWLIVAVYAIRLFYEQSESGCVTIEEPFCCSDGYVQFTNNNCILCKKHATLEKDADMDELVTIYHCNTEKEIDDRLCGESDAISISTYKICHNYENFGFKCPLLVLSRQKLKQ